MGMWLLWSCCQSPSGGAPARHCPRQMLSQPQEEMVLRMILKVVTSLRYNCQFQAQKESLETASGCGVKQDGTKVNAEDDYNCYMCFVLLLLHGCRSSLQGLSATVQHLCSLLIRHILVHPNELQSPHAIQAMFTCKADYHRHTDYLTV